ncbi:carbohydrate ABC transporter permease [Haloprofundus sp. MHR1]|uniref:carbohydrate ABC transporter permease n=1 Tax=Haloprofundus sp. MHR1 TaxID=2572921 RepID=UPI0010BEB79D|nr:carbohydrate ABC transporter permease [Haloprofundus sp. MHR1]QCJ46650.1 carbohydrate ABC transporter permease [Haloprofundus sp. MHR1]
MSSQTANDSTSGIDFQRIGLYAVLAAMAAFYLSPLESGLMTAFKSQEAFIGSTPFVPPPPSGFTVEPWFEAWSRLQLGVFNSLLLAIPATALSAVFGSLAAYGLTNVNWRGQVAVIVLFVAGIFVPYQSVLVPLTQFWTMVGLDEILAAVPMLAERSGLIELIITHTAYGIPICTILFRSYYATIDPEMLEAARLDGATVARIYWKIILPLSVPIFAVTLIYQFTQIWNDLLFALVLLTSPGNQVVTLSLNQLQGSMVQQYNLQMAGAFVAALPTLVVYVLFGEQFAEGVAGET